MRHPLAECHSAPVAEQVAGGEGGGSRFHAERHVDLTPPSRRDAN